MWWSKQSSRKNKPATVQAALPERKRRQPLIMPLEPRFMFDGAVAASHAEGVHVVADHGHVLDHLRPVEAAAAAVAPTGPAVIFIDSRVQDSASLLKGVAAGTEVVYLKSNQDGLQQIATYLAAHHEVGSVEIIAHGNDGELLLGDTNLTAANINSYAQELGAIGCNLKQGADILVYSCNTAADATGVAFVDTLARLTGHNIAASSNVTGVGGDWNLEVTTGDINAVAALSAQSEAGYKDELAASAIISYADDGTLGTLRYEIAHAGAGDVLYFDGAGGTVTLTAGALSITQNLTIESDVTGSGASGSQVIINANYASRVLTIGSGATVNLVGLTLEHGLLAGNGGFGNGAQGADAMGAGISNAGNLTLTNSNVTLNYATGGGGGGGVTGASVGGGGGGGSGAAGHGGGTGGSAGPSSGYYVGVAGGGGSGGRGGGYDATHMGGRGGTSAGGGAGGTSPLGGYAYGGNGASAAGGVTIGGGGGGGGWDATGGRGGNAAGGIYNSGKLYVVGTSAITSNLAAGGGGGGGGGAGNHGGVGGEGVGGIWNTSGGTVNMTSSAFTAMTGDVGGSGSVGLVANGGSNTGITSPSSFGKINTGSGTINETYIPPAPTVTSIDRVGSSPNNGTTELFTVIFSESVTGVDATDFSLTDTGTATGSIASVSGSGTTYTVTVNSVAGDGTMRLDLNSSGTGITDASSVAISGGYTSGQVYTIDHTAPTVSSINRTGSTPNNASSDSYTVTFSESVTGVDNSDFTAVTSGTADTSITVTPVSGSVYTVTINGVTGDGTIGLNLKGSGTGIADTAGNAITAGFTGQVYTVDHTPPTVSSITALGASPNNANSDQYQVVFSESVTGVVAADFTLTTTNTPGGTALTTGGITSITGSGTTYTVTIGTVAGDGTLRLDLKSNDSGITDTAGNGATAAFTSGDVYTIEHTPPSVSSIVANGSNPNNASSDQFTVTFTEAVNGVNAGDFGVNLSSSANYTGLSVTPLSATQYQVTATGVTGDGTLQLTFNHSALDVTDAAGNVANTDFNSGDTYTIEHTPPAVTSVGVPANATYIAGQNLDFTVNFSEAVVVTGTPEIGVTLDTGGTVYAQYLSGSGTSALTFRYTVVSGEGDTNGVTLDSAITANGGTIRDAATNNAVLTLNSVASTTGVLVDSIAPTVTSVGVPADGVYGTGQALDFTVNFSENVVVTTGGGTPYLNVTLDTGGTVHAAYVGGSGSNALTFAYTVVSGNNDPTGVAVGSSITLNGGTIKDAATNAAVLTLNSVGSTTNVLVDAIPPTVTSINTVDASTNNLTTEHFTVTFSTPVNGVDATDFTLVGTSTASGSITSVSGSGTTWNVTVGSVTGDGTLRLDLNNAGDPITDNFGNTLTAAHTGDQTYTIEHTPPAVASVTVPGNGTYVAGQNLDFTATFSEAVTVTGTPRIAVTLDTGGTVYANYVSGSGTGTLTFRYTVAAGNQDLTGITTPGSVIDLNGGTITDAATNAASGAGLNLTGEPSLASIDVDAIVPAVTSVVVPINGTYGTAQDLDFTVNFTKVVTVNTGGGTPYIQITLDTGGTVDAMYFSGSGSTSLVFRYIVPSGELDTNGITVGSSLVMGGGTIQDAIGNNADTTLNSVGSTTGVLVDSIPPTVTSIDTVLASTNNLGTETFTVTFSTDVSLNPPGTTDFSLHNTGSISGTISSVTPVSGSVYTVTVTGVTGDGTMRLDLNPGPPTITDQYGNPLTAAHTGDQTYTIEHTPPSATAMTVPAPATYGTGQNMDFTVTFSEAVTVDATGGTPRIAITLDTGGTVYANYLSGSGTGTLTFRYVPTSGVQDLTGIVTGTSIDANGGTIKDAATNNAVLAINAVEPSTASIDVDAILPVVTSVGVPANATYIAGQDLDFTVNLNKNVTVDTTGGTPYITLTLDTGGTVDAQYISGSGTSTLTFRYVVAPTNLDMTGVTVGSVIVLNSGTIVDSHSNPAALTLAGVASTTGVLVDAVPPTVTSIATVGSTLTNASSVTYTVTFSEAVTGVDASDFTLTDTGGTTGTIAAPVAVSGSVYTVTVNGIHGDGTMRLDLNSSGTGIADLATNAITTGFTTGGVFTFDHQPPTVVSVGVPAAGTYLGGQDLNFSVTYSTVVMVNGTPELAVTLDTGTVYAQYVSGSGSNTLNFTYHVANGNFDSDGIVIDSALTINGATIQDAITNNASLTLNNVGDATHVLVDGTNPAVSSITTVGNAQTNAASVTYKVNFSENVSGVNVSDFALTSSGSAAGSIASVTAGSGSSYTVTVDDISGDGTLRLDVKPSSGIVDAAGTAVPGFTSGESYTVDRIAPTVTSVGVPANGTYIGGQNLDFTVTYSSAVTLNTSGGEPSLTILLANGKTVQAQLLSASGNQLTFQYTVAAGDQDLTGISIGSSVNLNGATLVDSFGNAADLTLHGVASTALVDVDAVPPTVTSVQVPADGLYSPGENINLVVTFSEAVNVNTAGGTPGIAITLDAGGTVQAHYVSGSGSNALTFSYTVVNGNVDKTGITVANAITANGSSISSADHNVAVLTLNNVGSTANVDVGPAPHHGGDGRGLLPDIGDQQETPAVNPFVWVLPTNDGNNHQQSPEVLPSTTQTTWSSVPLLSAGQQGFGHVDTSGSRGDETAIGSSGFSTSTPSVIQQIVSPQRAPMPVTGTNLDRSNNLTWQPPSTIELPQNAGDILGALIPPTAPQLLRDVAPAGPRTFDARVAAHAEKHAPVAPLALHSSVGRHLSTGGKASLNQQFSRYGKSAWEREKSILVDHAQRNAQRRVG